MSSAEHSNIEAYYIKKYKSADSEKDSYHQIFVADVMCLDTTLTNLPLLPIGINTNMPHFVIPIGSEKVPLGLSVAYNICAAVNVGWAPLHFAIAKKEA